MQIREQISMKAAILTKLKKDLVIAEDVKLPYFLLPGQVLVKIYYSGVCGSQLGEIDGIKGEDKYLPHLLGHEGSGIVIQIGPGVSFCKEGQKVVLHWRKSLGIESETPIYEWQGEKINAGWVTTFNEYAVVSENRLTPIPDNLDLKIAALYGCAITTGFGVVVNDANLKIGESVVVFGAGGIGLNIIQAASMVSANPIIAVDLYANKLALARKLGATHAVNAKNLNSIDTIRNILKDRSLDVFIDNTGNPNVIESGYSLLGATGRLILVGVPPKDQNISIHSLQMHFGKKIVGSHGGNAIPHIDIPKYHALYCTNKLNLDELITDEYPLTQINVAIEAIKKGDVTGRCLIRMN